MRQATSRLKTPTIAHKPGPSSSVRPFQRQHDRFLSRPGRERVRHDALFYAARTAHDANRSGPAHCMHTFVIRQPPGSWYRVSVAALSWCVLEGAFCRTSGFGGGSVQTTTPCADLFGNGVQWEISAQRGGGGGEGKEETSHSVRGKKGQHGDDDA